MCQGKRSCKCRIRTLRANLLPSEQRVVKYQGRHTLVVPLIMARADVVMNGGLIPEEELNPEAWNGRPVTVGHPEDRGSSVSASVSPDVMAQWAVGTLFNCRVLDGALRGEAWLDVEKCNSLFPDLIRRLRSKEAIDVSTGYFSDNEEASGVLNGRAYNHIQRNLKPDHLALLPNQEGACNWKDGCGVRSNRRSQKMKRNKRKTSFKVQLAKAFETMAASLAKPATNDRGEEDDRRMIIADLLSNDSTPFMPDDEMALQAMSDDTLLKLKAAYLAKAEDEEEEADPEENEEDEEDLEDNEDEEDEEETKTAKKAKANTKGDAPVKKRTASNRKTIDPLQGLGEVIANVAKKAVTDVLNSHPALIAANEAAKQKRTALLANVTANGLAKEVAETMTDAQLEAVANTTATTRYAAYSGRPVPVDNKNEDVAKEMTAPSVVDLIRNRKKKEAA